MTGVQTCALPILLKGGDIVVFMSDGITSAFPSSTDLYEFLQNLKTLNPQSLADKILAGALEKTVHDAVDDMTLLCTRIFENLFIKNDPRRQRRRGSFYYVLKCLINFIS